MPVEIRELVIRAVATSAPEDSEQPQDPEGSPRAQVSVDDTHAIIQECVRQVLKILQKKKER
jgi:hypothetical protein